MLVTIRRAALRPVRAAARSSRSVLADEAERAMDGVLEGPLPEVLARALAEHQVLERITTEFVETTAADEQRTEQIEQLVERVLRSPALARWLADDGGRLVEPLAAGVLQSPAFRQAMLEIAGSAELRRALSKQSVGFGEELAAGARARLADADAVVEHRVHTLLRLRSRETPVPAPGGIGARGVALAVDVVLAQVLFLIAAATAAVIWSLVGAFANGPFAWSLAGTGWLVAAAAYFVAFWSSVGQTPGMRLMSVRVVTSAGQRLSVARSLVRFSGLIVAIIPLFAGFLPALVDARRRALQDFVAGTIVIDDDGRGVITHDDAPHTPAPPASPRNGPARAPAPHLRSIWRQVDGVRVHAVGGGAGRPVLLIHGFGVSGAYMLPLARLLAQAFRIYVPDLPGQGRSGRPSGPWRIEEMARALGGWLDAVGVHAPIVVANSLGCQVVTKLAVSRRGLVGPMVLIGPTVDPARRGARRQLLDALRDTPGEPGSLVGLAARETVNPDIGSLVTVARSALADRIEDRLPAIDQPTVVVHGERDRFLGRDWAERVADLLPRGRLVVVPAAAHAVHYTRPDLIATLVGELALLSPARASG